MGWVGLALMTILFSPTLASFLAIQYHIRSIFTDTGIMISRLLGHEHFQASWHILHFTWRKHPMALMASVYSSQLSLAHLFTPCALVHGAHVCPKQWAAFKPRDRSPGGPLICRPERKAHEHNVMTAEAEKDRTEREGRVPQREAVGF